MQQEIIISGFGGQGALFSGQLLAYAAMDSGHYVTWIPSYGPEMRGGKARCTVIVSDAEIGSPLVRRPTSSIVLNIPTIGPLLFTALVSQDSYLAGSCVFVLSALTVVGTLISDILLAYVDPRIRLVQ